MKLNTQSIIESTMIIAFLTWIIWGLKKQITILNSTVEAQKKTKDATIAELEKYKEQELLKISKQENIVINIQHNIDAIQNVNVGGCSK